MLTGVPALALLPEPLPPGELALMFAGGLCSGAAQLLLLAAFRRVAAATLAPLNYFQLLLAVLLSSFVFQRPPDAIALAGIAPDHAIRRLHGAQHAGTAPRGLTMSTALDDLPAFSSIEVSDTVAAVEASSPGHRGGPPAASSRIVEAEIARRMNVSRAPVREAARRLEREACWWRARATASRCAPSPRARSTTCSSCA